MGFLRTIARILGLADDSGNTETAPQRKENADRSSPTEHRSEPDPLRSYEQDAARRKAAQKRGDFRGRYLNGIDFSGKNLREADFSGASLQGASFRAAKLNDAKFRQAYLSCTDFRDADITGADFAGARFGGTQFTPGTEPFATPMATSDTAADPLLLDAALALARLGLSVIPLEGKQPRIRWKEFQERRAEEDEIKLWWQRWPTADIGVVAGRISGVVVLDVDGEPGRQSLSAHQQLPRTWKSTTGRGEHYWFRWPGHGVPNRQGLLPGVDRRGDGGYVVAPPSHHASGVRYEWAQTPNSVSLAEAPEWVLLDRSDEDPIAAAATDARMRYARAVEAADAGEANEAFENMSRQEQQQVVLELERGAFQQAHRQLELDDEEAMSLVEARRQTDEKAS